MPFEKIDNFDFSKITDQRQFILDTNVLYFVHSGYYGQTTQKNINYSKLIQTLIAHNCTIIVSAINLQELFHGVENNEYKLYLKSNKPSQKNYTKKDFRKNSIERKKIKNKLKVILAEIMQVYKIIDEKIAINDLKDFISNFSSHIYDPIDYILVKNNMSHKNVFFVTNDKDFYYDQNITVLIP